ncbi:MAG TPA: hypothetical protein VL832_23500 [Puia sp.]|nr:hypothetical protein [Puia sp.]
MEKRIKYGTTLLLLLITGLLVYGYFYHLSGGMAAPAKADIKVSARELINLADKNEARFDQLYLYKTLSVGGMIKDIIRSKSGSYTLLLGGNPSIPTSISCPLDSIYNSHSLSLRKGDSCSLRGTCAGRLADIILVQCIIEK